MNITDVCNSLFNNKQLYAKREDWDDGETICIMQIGWASQYNRTKTTKEKNDPSNFYIEHIKNNRLCGPAGFSIDDILANDWGIVE